jgi:HEAT repeat protein
MKKFILVIIAFFLIVLPSVCSALILGPYTGQIIDSQTGETVEGVSVLIYWEKRVPTLIEGHSELIKAELVYTDKEGRYNIKRFLANLGLLSSLESTQIIIYQPGYQAYIVKIWHDSTYSKPDLSFKEKDNIVKLDRIPPNFNHKEHYEKIDDALRGIDAYFGDPDKGMNWKKLAEINLKTLEKDKLLRRAEWEGRRSDSLGGVSCFPPDKEGYFEEWSEILRKGNSKEKVFALYNFPCVNCCKTDRDINVITLIINALNDSDPSVREEAISSLIRIRRFSEKCCKETNIVPGLVNALDDESALIRLEAAKALAYFKDKRAIDPLIKKLNDKDPWVRLNAVFSIGELGEKILTVSRAIGSPIKENSKMGSEFTATDSDKPQEIRYYAPKWGELGGDKSIDSLIELLNDDSDWRYKFIQQEVIITLRKMVASDRKIITVLMQKADDAYLRAEVIKTLGALNAADAKDILLNATKDSDEKIRKLALEALSRLHSNGMIKHEQISQKKQGGIIKGSELDSYIKSLQDPSAEVRAAAAEALGKIGDDKAIEPLIEALNDSNDIVKDNVIRALANYYRNERVLVSLVPLFGSRNLAVKTFELISEKTCKERVYIYNRDGIRYVVKNRTEVPKGSDIIERLVHTTAVDNLINALDNPNPTVKLSVLQIFWKFEDTRIEKHLIKLLNDPSPLVRRRAISLIYNAGGDKVVPRIIEALKDNDNSVRTEAVRALGYIQDKRALDPLIGILNDDDDNVKAAALSSLINFDDPRVLDLSIALLKDKSVSVRRTAVLCIKKKPDIRALESLISLLNDSDWLVATSAAEVLGLIGDTRAVNPLIDALNDKFSKNRMFGGDVELREKAAEALGNIGDEKAIESLKYVQKDSPVRVKNAAQKAMEKIKSKSK